MNMKNDIDEYWKINPTFHDKYDNDDDNDEDTINYDYDYDYKDI